MKNFNLEEVREKYKNNRDVISLFSGAMGLDIGLGKAGLNVVIGQDFEPSCVETMKANGHNVLGGDIREIKPETLLELTGLHVGEPFMICGGPPCQPFSTAGKYCFGTAPPKIFSSNINGISRSPDGSNSITTSPYCPCPPDCFLCFPLTLTLPLIVSR